MIGLFAPLAAAIAATLLLSSAGRHLHPSHATWLTGASISVVLVAGLIAAWGLTLSFLAHEPFAGDMFAWCREAFDTHHPLSWWLGVPASLTASWASLRLAHVALTWRRTRGSRAGHVQVVDSLAPIAFAETGRRGGVVVSTGMLSVLDDGERRALLAHEQAHLRLRHDRFLVLGALAAALPPLGIAAMHLRHGLERWADEEAARTVGDRTTVARAVARAALAAHERPSATVMALLGANVPARVEALMRPPLERRTAALRACFASLVVMTAVAAAAVQLHHLGGVLAEICLS